VGALDLEAGGSLTGVLVALVIALIAAAVIAYRRRKILKTSY